MNVYKELYSYASKISLMCSAATLEFYKLNLKIIIWRSDIGGKVSEALWQFSEYSNYQWLNLVQVSTLCSSVQWSRSQWAEHTVWHVVGAIILIAAELMRMGEF